jgi:hypothetical protein
MRRRRPVGNVSWRDASVGRSVAPPSTEGFAMSGFVQVIECHSHQFDKVQSLEHEYLEATKGKGTIRRRVITRDRSDATRYLIFVFFDSYESAMENQKLAETSEFGQKQAEYVDGPMSFTDLDLISDEAL